MRDKIAGVVIVDWKLPTFEKHLKAAGYDYTVNLGLTKDTITLHVNYEWAAELTPIIEQANTACRH